MLGLAGGRAVMVGGLDPSWPGQQQRCGVRATPASSFGDAKAAKMLLMAVPVAGVSARCCEARLLSVACAFLSLLFLSLPRKTMFTRRPCKP